jgi:nitrogen fixation-related uncharacterized protein
MRTVLLSVAALWWGIGSGAADDVDPGSASRLRQLCASTNELNKTVCGVYVAGLLHGILIGTNRTRQGQPFCIPDGFTAEQVKVLFEKWAIENPNQELLKLPANIVVASVLLKTFPCRPPK